MKPTKPLEDWTVDEVIDRSPQAISVFNGLRMACVGCVMAPHETVAEVARAYDLELEMILKRLRKYCRNRP